MKVSNIENDLRFYNLSDKVTFKYGSKELELDYISKFNDNAVVFKFKDKSTDTISIKQTDLNKWTVTFNKDKKRMYFNGQYDYYFNILLKEKDKNMADYHIPFTIVQSLYKRRLINFTPALPASQKWKMNTREITQAMLITKFSLSKLGEQVANAFQKCVVLD